MLVTGISFTVFAALMEFFGCTAISAAFGVGLVLIVIALLTGRDALRS